jgi:hypothetical protein
MNFFNFLNWSSSKIISYVIISNNSKFLGKFFKKFDHKNININVWGGNYLKKYRYLKEKFLLMILNWIIIFCFNLESIWK